MASRSCVGLGDIIVISCKKIIEMQSEKIKSIGKKKKQKTEKK